MVLSGLAEQERQKGPPHVVEVRNEEGKVVERRKEGMDPSFLAELVDKTGKVWEKVCNFEWPRLASVMVQHQPLDLSRYSDEELAELERLHALGRSAGALPGRVDPTTRPRQLVHPARRQRHQCRDFRARVSLCQQPDLRLPKAVALRAMLLMLMTRPP